VIVAGSIFGIGTSAPTTMPYRPSAPAFSVSPMMCSALHATLSLALKVGRGRVLRERVLGCSGAASMCCKQAALRENG
jgi:hypothetical protein